MLTKKRPKNRMKKTLIIRSKIWAVVALPIVLLTNTTAAVAASSLSISPGFLQVSFTTTDNVQDTSFTISNNSTSPATFSVKAVDVDALSPTLTPLTAATSAAARAITIKDPKPQLEPSRSANILLSIDGSKLAAGGQYAAVIVKQESAQNTTAIPLQQAVAVTLFLTREDGAVRTLHIASQLPKGIVFSRPSISQLDFKNNGNTDITPRAAVTIEHGGKVVAKALSSSTQVPLFAKKTVNAKLTNVYSQKFGMGKYHYQVQYRYDGQAEPSVVKSTFYYVPLWYAVIVGLGFTSLVVFIVQRRRQLGLLIRNSTKIRIGSNLTKTRHIQPPEESKNVVKKTKKVSKRVPKSTR
jgi:hypothetical protein